MSRYIHCYVCQSCSSELDFVSTVTPASINCPQCNTVLHLNGILPDLTQAEIDAIIDTKDESKLNVQPAQLLKN